MVIVPTKGGGTMLKGITTIKDVTMATHLLITTTTTNSLPNTTTKTTITNHTNIHNKTKTATTNTKHLTKDNNPTNLLPLPPTKLVLPPTNNTNQASSSSSLPSQPLPNPKGSINVIILRSGITLEEVEPKPIKLAKDVPNVEVGETMEVDEDEKEEDAAKEVEEQLRAKELKRKSTLEEQIPIPFPTLAKKAKEH
ncbi:hypothetical protein AHAS_Ahas15G0282700 [Arachis hypogaea]